MSPFGTAGGNGIGASIILMDNQVVFTVCESALVAQAVAPLPATCRLPEATIVHVLGTVDLLANDTVSLYINNVHWPTARKVVNITNGGTGDLLDWAGTDDGGIARSQGTTGGDTATAPGLGGLRHYRHS